MDAHAHLHMTFKLCILFVHEIISTDGTLDEMRVLIRAHLGIPLETRPPWEYHWKQDPHRNTTGNKTPSIKIATASIHTCTVVLSLSPYHHLATCYASKILDDFNYSTKLKPQIEQSHIINTSTLHEMLVMMVTLAVATAKLSALPAMSTVL